MTKLTSNILIIGNSGCGKTTLVNSILGENKGITGFGAQGTTKEIKAYTSDKIPFRLVDTVGFEPIKHMGDMIQNPVIKSVQNYLKKSVETGESDSSEIHCIWFCVDGTAAKLFPKTIKDLDNATKIYKSIPLIVVVTKAYSKPDRERNIAMIEESFRLAKIKRHPSAIIPVVAQKFDLDEESFAPTFGIEELIQKTNDLLPEGAKMAEKDRSKWILERKKVWGQSIVFGSVASAATVGAVSLPFADGIALGGIETAMINGIGLVYGLKKDDAYKVLKNSIVSIGTVSVAAKQLIAAIKLIPGIQIAGAALNAVVAGAIVLAIGEGSLSVFEKIYQGELDIQDIPDIVAEVEKYFQGGILEKFTSALQSAGENADYKEIVTKLIEAFKN